ncbi:TMhelix containing protein [Vibrio phage 2.275.O._10N.286.54.E11]|nr:TMhelix containing protein [Vibrio phage 2.275.O._10N.286.54.E11]
MTLIYLVAFILSFLICIFSILTVIVKRAQFTSFSIEWDFPKKKYVVYRQSCGGLLRKVIVDDNSVMFFDTKEEALKFIETIKPVRI